MPTDFFSELSERDALVEHLRGLYPYLPADDFDEKLRISVKSGVFTFYRAFVTYFYDLLRRKHLDSGFPDLHGIDSIEGWCAGDAHPENFGVVYCHAEQKQPRFVMNDPDDGGPGPLYADLLRFLTGVLLFDPDASLEPLINAYRQGVDGDGNLSTLVAREIARAAKKPMRPDKLLRRSAKGNLKPKRTLKRRFDFSGSASAKERRQIEAGMQPLIKAHGLVLDIWKLKKRGGGSGGLDRYWVLLAPHKKGKRNGKSRRVRRKMILILDLKTLVRPGIHALVCPKMSDSAKRKSLACSEQEAIILNRVGETLDLVRGLAVGGACDVLKFDGLPPMVVRARWKGNRAVALDADYTPRELAHLLKDEAKALGHIHRRSLPVGSHYSGHIHALGGPLIECAVRMESVFKCAVNVLGTCGDSESML